VKRERKKELFVIGNVITCYQRVAYSNSNHTPFSVLNVFFCRKRDLVYYLFLSIKLSLFLFLVKDKMKNKKDKKYR